MSKYGILKDLYPRHLDHFYKMQARAKKVGTDFSFDRSGFLEFVEFIGPIPDSMTRPSVGRKDHDKGYVRGNFFWQSLADNVSEMNTRVWSGRSHTDETRSLMSTNMKGITRSEEAKANMRKAWQLRRNSA